MTALALFTVAALLGLGIALLVGVYAMSISTALDLLDHPDGGRKLHARATPLVGGIAVAGATVAGAMLVFLQTGDPQLVCLAIAVAAMFIIGIVDDRRHLPPLFRLVVAVVALGIVVAIAPGFQLTMLQFSGSSDMLRLGGYVGLGFTLLCLVGLLNAVNMADGKNGIVIGMGLVWTLVLWPRAAPALWPLLFTVFTALVVIFIFNMRGKLFLGDGGSYALSALFGLFAIFVYNGAGAAMFADDVTLLFAIPVFDTIRLMVTRIAGGRSPFHADRDHLHHHLFARIGWPRGLWVYLGMVALPNAAALVWRGTGFAWLAISFIAYGIVMAMTRFSPAGRPAE